MQKETRPLPLLLTIVFTLILSSFFYAQDKNLPPPNILWITSEDNSPLLGCYGDAYATTPNLDQLAAEGVLYQNAFATAPVCAPSRNTLITGVYPPSMGTQHMRSRNAIPDFIRYFPYYLQQRGYYCTNPGKTDYNLAVDQKDGWSDRTREAHYRNRAPGQPFFHVVNFTVSHESSLHKPLDSLVHDPEKAPIPPYHPRTPEFKHDWAQYYDKVMHMDAMVGEVLKQLEEDGLAENTIVFYYSDHGGVLGRSKRFMYESGLHIPLIIRFPEQYRHLAPAEAGGKTDRIVTFLDFPPTVLSLAGVPIPAHMQGVPFLGAQQQPEREYAHCFRGRMDERFDFSRAVRDKQFLYVRNYMPHRIYAQYIEYLWRAPSMKSWESAYRNGECNAVQSAFWQPKPPEELYDCKADPHNINNLANDPAYKAQLEKMRKANCDYVRKVYDSGFFPEAEMKARAEGKTIYEMVRANELPLERIMATAEMATMGNPENLEQLQQRLKDQEPVVRYWAATGCIILGEKARAARPQLEALTQDPNPSVRIAAAEALYQLGETDQALTILREAVQHHQVMVRVHAINVLELMGTKARPVLPVVKKQIEQMEDNDYDERAALRLVAQLEQ